MKTLLKLPGGDASLGGGESVVIENLDQEDRVNDVLLNRF